MCPMQLRALEEAGPYSSKMLSSSKMLPALPGVVKKKENKKTFSIRGSIYIYVVFLLHIHREN